MTSIRSIILRLTLTLLAVCLFIEPANANERRLALVIANEDYPVSIGRLNNTHEDAAEIEIALTAAGFEVTRVLDASAAEMETAIADFEIAIDAAAANGEDVIAFFYGSMHGVAADVEGQTRNFLVPANEEITSTGQLIRKGIRIDQIVAGLAATQAKGVIIVSDACRNDIGLSLTKSVGTKGFVPVQGGPGVLLAYATSQGATTPDDGLFAKTLAREISKPGRKASFSMLAALEETARFRSFEGQPFMTSGGLPDWFCFRGCAGDDIEIAERDTDYEDWVRFNATGQEQAYQTYLTLHPDGRYVAEANARIAALSSATPTSSALSRSVAVSAVETQAWDAIPTGSCEAYRSFIERFPDGDRVTDALLRLATRRTLTEEAWTPAERALRLYLFQDGEAVASREQGIAAAQLRADYEAEGLCMGFAATSSYRVKSARAEIVDWDCTQYPSGFVCGGRGNAICDMDVRGTTEREICGGE